MFFSFHLFIPSSNLQINNNPICMPYHWDSVNHEVFQYLMETLLGFLIPFTFIVVCYTSVICRLRSAMFRGRVKGSLLILLIITAFAVFWLPYHIINILQVHTQDLQHGHQARRSCGQKLFLRNRKCD